MTDSRGSASLGGKVNITIPNDGMVTSNVGFGDPWGERFNHES